MNRQQIPGETFLKALSGGDWSITFLMKEGENSEKEFYIRYYDGFPGAITGEPTEGLIQYKYHSVASRFFDQCVTMMMSNLDRTGRPNQTIVRRVSKEHLALANSRSVPAG